MRTRASSGKLLAVTFVALLLSVLFVFLGAPLLRVLRNVYGPKVYWGIGIASTLLLGGIGLFPIAILLLSLWACVGIYSELEEAGYANVSTGFLALVVASAVVLFSPPLIMKMTGFDMVEALRLGIDQILVQLKGRSGSWLHGMEISAETIMGQVPSIIFLMNLASLSTALMFDVRMAQMFGLRFEKVAARMRLLEFRLPDICIWILMLSFLFTFIKVQNPMIGIVASNVFNVLVGIYFFQGLAILEVIFAAWRVHPIIRTLCYLIIVGQLFLLLSFLGVIDFWIDIRARLKKLKPTQGNHNNEERI